MLIYKPESLELLRQRIDLAEVVSSHIQLQRAGGAFKALCPFHDEKTPSFVISKGDKHYHCFGCGAHGDAIAFLMGHLRLSFVEAIESLAERFQVPLEKIEGGDEHKGPSKIQLRQALDKACRIYHYALLHSEEAVPALEYLKKRGIDRAFIEAFHIGFAPKEGHFLLQVLRADGFQDEILEHAGLLSSTRMKDFFSDRIMFPIRDAVGAVIGFSARKFREDTFGGKYINTPETPLFKKSHILFGLSYSRQRIAKERKAIVVEGQIDALRLIFTGFNYTVAGQGTAFGEGHVKELLQLGANRVYLAMDADGAGQEAAVKIGDLFQKKGVGVTVVGLPTGADPDSFLREHGPDEFAALLEKGMDYLTFLVKTFSQKHAVDTPAGKNELVKTLAAKIRGWEQPLMVFESLRRLAQLTHVPESLLGIDKQSVVQPYVQRSQKVAFLDIDPDRILESDLLRLLFLAGESTPQVVEIVRLNIQEEHFYHPLCRRLFALYMKSYLENKPRDFCSLAIESQDHEEQAFFSEIIAKKINLLRAESATIETVRRLLERHWMKERAEITQKIQACLETDDALMDLVKKFDSLKTPPKVLMP